MLRKVTFAVLFAATLACSRTPKQPDTDTASPLALEANLGNAFVRSGASQTAVARIAFSTKHRESAARPPVNLALLVDTSGSMDGKAIADARKASLALLDSLSPKDRLSVVVFNSKVEVLLPSTTIEDCNLKELRTKLSTMKAEGTTDMADGLNAAVAEVSGHLAADGVNRILLLGDGVPNDDTGILSTVEQAARQGISVTALGLGEDYDETLMARIAQKSGGKYTFVADSSKVPSFFAEEVTRLHKVVARNAVLEIHPGPGVTVQNVVGRVMSPTSHHGISVNLGDITLGDAQEIVVQLATQPTKEGANVEMLDAVLRYDDGVGGRQREERIFLGAKSTTDDARIGTGRDPKVEDAAAKAKDAAALIENIEKTRQDNRRQQADEQNVPAQLGGAGGQNRKPAAPKPAAKSGAALTANDKAPAAAAVDASGVPASNRDQLQQHADALHKLGL